LPIKQIPLARACSGAAHGTNVSNGLCAALRCVPHERLNWAQSRRSLRGSTEWYDARLIWAQNGHSLRSA